jgi:hypothetical protein
MIDHTQMSQTVMDQSAVNPALQETLRSLANLDFGSETTLAPFQGSAAPFMAESSFQTQAAPAATPLVAAQPSTSSEHEPVASAIASFCSLRTSLPPVLPPVMGSCNLTAVPIPVQSAADAKSADFSKKIREIDEQLKLKIGAHRLRHLSNEKFGTPIPQDPAAKDQFKSHPAFQPQKSPCPVLRMSHPPKLPDGATYSWSVYCNQCNKNMLDEHFHCNSCENGDYDLCTDCVAKGKHCLDEQHWLIKRYLRNGKVINGTTQKHASSPKTTIEVPMGMPGAFTEEKKIEKVKKPTRTCNCCVKGSTVFTAE